MVVHKILVLGVGVQIPVGQQKNEWIGGLPKLVKGTHC